MKNGRAQALVVRTYRSALRLYPAEFRKYYSGVMLEAFTDRYDRVTQDGGVWAKTRFYLWLIRDMCVSLVREHITSAARRLRQSSARQPGRAAMMDVRYALRSMRRSPAFTLVALVTLALGIGANVAMFSTAHYALVSSLPFVDPDRLVAGRATFDGNLNPWAAGADYFDYRDRAEAFENIGTIMPFGQEHTISGGETPERVTGTAVSTNLFATLGVNPQIGRHFVTEEGLADAPDVVLISHAYWQSRFGQSPDVLGGTLTIDAQPYTVVGVMPPGFRFMPEVAFWRAMRPDRDGASERIYHNWYLVGRLAPGISIEQAQTQVDVISSQLEASYPETNDGKALRLEALHSVLVADYRTRLYLLTAAVALVLLIACANVTGMLLARAPARRVELSVRAALGASRSRLIMQLLAENIVLAVAAGVLGTVVAVWMQQMILQYMQMDLPSSAATGISGSMLAYAVVLAGTTGVLVGIYPALSGAQSNLAEDLKVGSRRVTGAGMRFRTGLVVAQVAVSVVLLVGSALLLQSFTRERAVDPGFDPTNVLTVELELPRSEYGEPDRVQFFSALLDDVRAIPGVQSASIINHLPIRSPRNTFPIYTPGTADTESRPSAFLRATVPGYFATMGIPLLAGRGIEAYDDARSAPVVVINQKTADEYFPGGDAVGGELIVDFFGDAVRLEVVGVVGDVRMSALNTEPRSAIYLSYMQRPFNTMQLAVRTDVDPISVVRPLRSAVWGLDDDVPLAGIATMRSLISDSMSERKTIALSLTLYAALPLLLAAVGLYAVLAYHVSQRSHELGVRMALGADARELGRSVLLQGVGLVVVGLVVGLAGAVGVTRLIQQLLFGVEATDLLTYVSVSLFILAVALIACIVPAWRAVRTDPMAVLQAE
jgi:putative ABC transport system permease protein